MNKSVKETLGFIIRIINKYNYRVMFLKENENHIKIIILFLYHPPNM